MTIPVGPRALTSWEHPLDPDGRDVTELELTYIRSRVEDLDCPFCRDRKVHVGKTRCLCGTSVLTVHCDNCGAVAPFQAELLERASGPAQAARRLREHWRENAVIAVRRRK